MIIREYTKTVAKEEIDVQQSIIKNAFRDYVGEDAQPVNRKPGIVRYTKGRNRARPYINGIQDDGAVQMIDDECCGECGRVEVLR